MTKNVYFLTTRDCPGPVKIGCSVEPEVRLRAFLAWSPYPLKILHSFPGEHKDERRIQGHFAEHHMHSEWFEPAEEIFEFVKALKSGTPLSELVDMTGPAKGIHGIDWQKKNPSFPEYQSYKTKLSRAGEKASRLDFWGDKRLRKGYEIAESFLSAWFENGRFCDDKPTAPQLEFVEKVTDHLKHLLKQHKLREDGLTIPSPSKAG